MIGTVEQLKERLNISVARDKDAFCESCLTQSSAMIKTLCNQPIEAESVTEFFSGNNLANKLLNYTVPVNTLTSLHYRTLPSDSWTSQAATLYQDGFLYAIYNSSSFTYPFYKAVLNVGYSTIPDDLKNASLTLAAEIFLQSDENRIGVSSVSTSQAGMTITKAMRPVVDSILPILSKYTRILIA